MDTQQTTIASYDQVSNQYLTKNRDRSVICESLTRFANLVTSGGLILDIGCGPGFDAKILRDKGFQVHGLDRSKGMIQTGKNNFPGTFVQGDMTHLPFLQAADGLWVNASLLHIQRDKVPLVLREFYRILRPNGILYVAVQKGTEEQWRTGPYTETTKRWFTYWTSNALKKQLIDSKFEILDLQSNAVWLNFCAKKRS